MKSKIKNLIFILVFIFSLFLLIFLCNIVYSSFMNKLLLENYTEILLDENSMDVFTIDKIVCFSSCTSDSTINSNNSTTINNLSQYTDIAIFINSSVNSFSMQNTLKSVSIKDISFNVLPSSGTPNLYYKSLTSFATPNIVEDNLLDSELNFKVSAEDEINFDEPILFNNCANPITLSYRNSDIISNYTITNTDNSITYDGSLLKKCNVLLNNLNCSISFTVYIENNLGEQFRCPVYLDIPLESSTSSIYDGSYTYIYNPDYQFHKY